MTAQVALLDADGVLLASTDPTDQSRLGEQLEIPGFREVLLSQAVIRVDYGQRPGTGAAEVLVPVIIGRRRVGVIRATDPLSSVYERFPRTRTFIAWVLATGLLVGAGLGWFFAFGLERPLRRATRAISQMAAGETLAVLPEQGPQEIRSLLHAFNTLTERLQNLEKARQRLLANLVHELGRPLGALLSAIQALSSGADDDPALQHELLEGMKGEMQRMQRLLDDLTHLYDTALGPLQLDRKPTALYPWLTQVLGPLAGGGPEQRVTLASRALQQPADTVWLGVSGITVSPEVAQAMGLPEDQEGVLVAEIVSDSPADEAGLRGSYKPVTVGGQQLLVGGDVIVAWDNQPVTQMEELRVLVGGASPGQEVTLTILRDGARVDVQVTLEARPTSQVLTTTAGRPGDHLRAGSRIPHSELTPAAPAGAL